MWGFFNFFCSMPGQTPHFALGFLIKQLLPGSGGLCRCGGEQSQGPSVLKLCGSSRLPRPGVGGPVSPFVGAAEGTQMSPAWHREQGGRCISQPALWRPRAVEFEKKLKYLVISPRWVSVGDMVTPGARLILWREMLLVQELSGALGTREHCHHPCAKGRTQDPRFCHFLLQGLFKSTGNQETKPE